MWRDVYQLAAEGHSVEELLGQHHSVWLNRSYQRLVQRFMLLQLEESGSVPPGGGRLGEEAWAAALSAVNAKSWKPGAPGVSVLVCGVGEEGGCFMHTTSSTTARSTGGRQRASNAALQPLLPAPNARIYAAALDALHAAKQPAAAAQLVAPVISAPTTHNNKALLSAADRQALAAQLLQRLEQPPAVLAVMQLLAAWGVQELTCGRLAEAVVAKVVRVGGS